MTTSLLAPTASSGVEAPSGATGRAGAVSHIPDTAPATIAAKGKGKGDPYVDNLRVRWKGKARKSAYSKTIAVPGIGGLKATCRKGNVSLQLKVRNRQAETQMWTSKFEIKNRKRVVAVKSGRVYRFDTATDDGTGGTGKKTLEGLNQFTPIENFSNGYLYGLISQRPGRNKGANAAPLRPTTAFRVNWYWNDFRFAPRFRFCELQMKITRTEIRPMGLNWHGDSDAGRTSSSKRLNNLGRLQLKCRPSNDNSGQSVTFYPRSRKSQVYAEFIQGEGDVNRQVRAFTRNYPVKSKRFGPYALPNNGMVRMFLRVGKRERVYLISSAYKTNDSNPARNFCNISASQF